MCAEDMKESFFNLIFTRRQHLLGTVPPAPVDNSASERGFAFPCSQAPNRDDTPTPQPSDKASSINQTPVEANEFPQLPEGLEKKPIVLKFSAVMDGITIGAALLPSLKAEYKMGRMKSHGMTGESKRRLPSLPAPFGMVHPNVSL